MTISLLAVTPNTLENYSALAKEVYIIRDENHMVLTEELP
jgi:hypothetical protein